MPDGRTHRLLLRPVQERPPTLLVDAQLLQASSPTTLLGLLCIAGSTRKSNSRWCQVLVPALAVGSGASILHPIRCAISRVPIHLRTSLVHLLQLHTRTDTNKTAQVQTARKPRQAGTQVNAPLFRNSRARDVSTACDYGASSNCLRE